jgi:hypothetical protein
MINKRTKRVLLILPFLLVIVGVMALFMPAMVAGNELAATTNPCYNISSWFPCDFLGHPFSCPDCHEPGGSTVELRIESTPINGTHSDGTLTVTITGDSGDIGSGFSWSSNIPVCYLIVKTGGGHWAMGYSLPDGTNCGSWPGKQGQGTGISHVSFCYDPTGSTTTTTQATTTTTEATTTTTEPTTTTTQGTTTTTQGTTTTTEGTTTTTQGTTTTTEGTTTTTQGTTTTTEGTTTTTQGTTTTTEGTTTTTEGTTTTTEGTTTTTEGTTTTTEGTTTTTEGTTSTTGGTTSTTGGTTVTTSTLEVLGIQELPFTGYDSLWYVVGAVLISLGILTGTFSLATASKRK